MINLVGPNWKIKNIKAIIFDKDGTIINNDIYWGAVIRMRSRELVKELKLDRFYYKKICKVLGFSIKNKRLLQNGPIALVSREEVIDILFNFFYKNNINISKDRISNIFIKVHKKISRDVYKYTKILPRVKDFFNKLEKENIKLALVTADSSKNAEKIMRHLKLEKKFDLIIGKESTKEPKSSGIPAIRACKLLKVKTSETICIGDAYMDIIMAKNAKLISSIIVSTGQTPYSQLKKQNKYTIKSLSQLSIEK